MSHHAGFLYFLDDEGNPCEIINHQRLLGAVGTVSSCGSGIVFSQQDCQWENGVLPFALDPCDLVTQLSFNAPTWPGNPAPWWDGVPNSVSSGGLGFWIEEWTGLDGTHHARSVSPRIGRRGGGTIGTLQSKHRIWKLNVVLVGTSGAALDDLRLWLESMLLQCCDPCGGNDMLIRTSCPPQGQPEFGLYRVHDAALIEGPTWEDPPTESGACTMRRASFTIAVGDPCLYACAQQCADEEQFTFIGSCVPFNLWFGCDNTCDEMAEYRICCPVPAATRGTVSPVITILNDGPNQSAPLRIYGMADPLSLGCDPCTLPVCQDIRTVPLPAGSTLMIDSSTRKVLFASGETGGSWVDGTPFLDPLLGTVPDFLQLSCDAGWVAIEPLAFCGDTNNLKFTIDTVQRVGCC